ncbi:hypothetical protein M434DRAFT_14943 [Hypoxylon sp. CO27-5]|nr:hypothetical protein M434DRAFT_14943 [Hypoxylon sp. CO27-5]
MKFFNGTKSAFPAEIWMLVVDVLEEEDDRASMAALVQCNSKLRDIIQKRLYADFTTITHGRQRDRSFIEFTETVAFQPQIARLVKSLRIEYFPWLWDATLIPRATQVLGMDTSMLRESDLKFRTGSCILLQALISLLPNLKSLYLGIRPHIEFSDQEVYHLRYWAKFSPLNCFFSLQTVNIGFDLFGDGLQVMERLGLFIAAPALQNLRLRMRHDPLKYWPHRDDVLEYPGEAMDTLLQLRDVHIDYHQVEVLQGFHFLQHCNNIKSLAYTKGELENTPGFPNMTTTALISRGFVKWKRIATLTGARLNSLLEIYRRIRSSRVYTLRHLKKLQVLKITQEATIYAAMARHGLNQEETGEDAMDLSEDSNVSKRLRSFFPPSLSSLHLVDVDRKLLAGI